MGVFILIQPHGGSSHYVFTENASWTEIEY